MDEWFLVIVLKLKLEDAEWQPVGWLVAKSMKEEYELNVWFIDDWCLYATVDDQLLDEYEWLELGAVYVSAKKNWVKKKPSLLSIFDLKTQFFL